MILYVYFYMVYLLCSKSSYFIVYLRCVYCKSHCQTALSSHGLRITKVWTIYTESTLLQQTFLACNCWHDMWEWNRNILFKKMMKRPKKKLIGPVLLCLLQDKLRQVIILPSSLTCHSLSHMKVSLQQTNVFPVNLCCKWSQVVQCLKFPE